MKRFVVLTKKFLSRFFSGLGGYSGSDGGLSGGFSGAFGMWPFLPGAGFDYRTEAGALWDNSIVLAGIGWIATTLPEAQLGVGGVRGHASDPTH